MKHAVSLRDGLLASSVLGLLCAVGAAQAAEGAAAVLRDRSIGYVMTAENRAIYETHNAKEECPNGFNDGPREHFKARYPEGTKRTVIGTQLAREAETWFPSTSKEPYPFYEIQGKTGIGLNLDGKVGPSDFTSPDGEKGIDNQLYRAIGCIRNYREEGETSILTPQWRSRYSYNIIVIELTDVDSLANDDGVTVTTYRGTDKLISDATGNSYLPGGTQTVDMRWGKKFIQKFHGKITDGVLTTEARDLTIPAASIYQPRDGAPDIFFHDMRFKLKISADAASGFMGGYVDIEDWYTHSNKTRDTAHQTYGNTSGPSMYRALKRLADAYPDTKTGENTAISSAMNVNFTQVFVKHPEAEVALETGVKTETRTAAARTATRESGSR
jgi:hypothetical protein